MKKDRKHWSVKLEIYGGSFRADSTTYGLSDSKVGTSIADIVIIFDKIGRADVRLVSQTFACLLGGGCVKRALGGVLSRAQRTIWEGPAACCHKIRRLISFALPEARTKGRTIHPGIQRLYRRLIYVCLFRD